MNRTYLLTRRTLLCAVFACPLALLSPWWGAGCQLFFSLYAAAFLPVAQTIWKKRQVSPAAEMRRVLFPISGALFLGYFPLFLLLAFFPGVHTLTRQLLQLFSSLTALLLQCALLRLFLFERREHKYFALICLIFFIVCMQSVA